jgi:hypothetical protein
LSAGSASSTLSAWSTSGTRTSGSLL